MAYILVNPDGTSNAKAGDYVVTGGGIFQKLADGSSKLVDVLPTASGKSKSYEEVKDIFSKITNATGQDRKVQQDQGITVEDNPWNYDDFQSLLSGESTADYNLNNSSLNFSTIIGYGIVALVGIVIIDRLLK